MAGLFEFGTAHPAVSGAAWSTAMVLGLWLRFVRRRPGYRPWQPLLADLQRKLGGHLREGRSGRPVWRGTVDGVTVEVHGEGWIAHNAAVVIQAGPLPDNLAVWSDARLDLGLRPGAITTGDPAFDAAVHIRGADPSTLAILNAETRGLILDTCAAGIWAEGGAWRWREGNTWASPDELHARIGQLAAVAKRWSTPPATDALAEIAQWDPVPTARARALAVLSTVSGKARSLALEMLEHHGSAAEAPLTPENADLVVATAIDLAARGTPEHLPRLADWSAAAKDGPERQVFDGAAASIRSRQGPDAAGSLMLASATGGELSAATTEHGGLSRPR